MGIVERVGDRDHTLVETPVARLVTTDQQDGRPAGIESIEHTQRLPGDLDAEFAEARMARARDAT